MAFTVAEWFVLQTLLAIFAFNIKKGLNKAILISLLLTITISYTEAQSVAQERFIQVDGIVYDAQKNPLPNISIFSLSLRKGTTSRTSGIYSIISVPGDTIVFSAVGLSRTMVFVPDSATGNRFFRDVYMDFDTIAINDVLVLPWATYDEFKKAVLEADINDYEVNNMNENLLLIQKQIISDIGVSPEAAYRHVMSQFGDAALTRNQFPSNNLLNPFAWAKFFQGLKSGLLRNEKKDGR